MERVITESELDKLSDGALSALFRQVADKLARASPAAPNGPATPPRCAGSPGPCATGAAPGRHRRGHQSRRACNAHGGHGTGTGLCDPFGPIVNALQDHIKRGIGCARLPC